LAGWQAVAEGPAQFFSFIVLDFVLIIGIIFIYCLL